MVYTILKPGQVPPGRQPDERRVSPTRSSPPQEAAAPSPAETVRRTSWPLQRKPATAPLEPQFKPTAERRRSEAPTASRDATSVPTIHFVSPKTQGIPSPSVERGGTVRRVKIKLKDEDPELMGRLRTVPVPQEGNQTLDDPATINTLNEIGQHESIVFEGHGYYNDPLIGRRKVTKQGDFSPRQLATFARSVPKPNNWDGNIYLMGCSTGDITEAVSKEYYKLTNSEVRVIGTMDNIRVGSKWDDTTFVGHDWDNLPQNQRPADLAFVKEVETEIGNFWDRAREMIRLIRQILTFKQTVKQAFDNLDLTNFQTNGFVQNFQSTTVDVQQLFTNASRIKNIDGLTTNPKIDNKEYGLTERRRLYDYLADVVREMGDIDAFNMPSTLQFAVNVNAGDHTALAQAMDRYNDFNASFNDAITALQALVNQGTPLYEKLSYYFKGLTLKEIDLTDLTHVVHHKMRRTATSIFGDTWEER